MKKEEQRTYTRKEVEKFVEEAHALGFRQGKAVGYKEGIDVGKTFMKRMSERKVSYA